MQALEQDSSTEAVELQDVQLTSVTGETILAGISWHVDVGSIAAVIGPSGSGKTRLLRLLNRLDEPTAGTLRVLGKELAAWHPGELRRTVGWVAQRPALSAGTGRANMEVPRRLGVVGVDVFEQRLERAVDVAGVTAHMLDSAVSRLSGGERQRIAIARALLLEPRVLLLDEPTSSIDGAGAAALLEALRGWVRDTGATLVVVTHRLSDVRALDGELLMLESGRVAHTGAAAALLDAPEGDQIRALLAGEAP